ncbi:MAG: acyl-CoA dehydrogenase family protein [Rhodospirillales bacterium]
MNAINFDKLGETLAGLTASFSATAAEYDRDGSFPFPNFAQLHTHGLLALTIPATHGGGGADLATTARVIRAVARGEPSTALVLTMQYIFHRSMVRGWAPEVRDRVRQDAVRDGALINALRVEPELGTPSRGGLPATIGRRVDGGWRISGHKLYSTGFQSCIGSASWGRTDEAEPRVGFFLVPRAADGIEVVEKLEPPRYAAQRQPRGDFPRRVRSGGICRRSAAAGGMGGAHVRRPDLDDGAAVDDL